MEELLYEDQDLLQDVELKFQNKKSLSLDLFPSWDIYGKSECFGSDFLTSPDIGIPSPVLEKLVIKNLGNTVKCTPTSPVEPLLSGLVTEEQERFAQGFTEALNRLHTEHNDNITIKTEPVENCEIRCADEEIAEESAGNNFIEATGDDAPERKTCNSAEITVGNSSSGDVKKDFQGGPPPKRYRFISYDFQSEMPLPSFAETFSPEGFKTCTMNINSGCGENGGKLTLIHMSLSAELGQFIKKCQQMEQTDKMDCANDFPGKENITVIETNETDKHLNIENDEINNLKNSPNLKNSVHEEVLMTSTDMFNTEKNFFTAGGEEAFDEKHWLNVHSEIINSDNQSSAQIELIPLTSGAQSITKLHRKRKKNRITGLKHKQQKKIKVNCMERVQNDFSHLERNSNQGANYLVQQAEEMKLLTGCEQIEKEFNELYNIELNLI